MTNSKNLINLIQNKYINEKGILSETYPPSDKHLLAHLDDFVPFLLYHGELDFVKNQILKGAELNHESTLVRDNNRIVSYLNNEFIGGISSYYKMTSDHSIGQLLDRTMKAVEDLLTYEGVITSYYNIFNDKTSPISAPISGGLIEVLVENADTYPDLGEIALQSLQKWIFSGFFKKYGLFPSKYHIKSSMWNKIFPFTHIPIPLKIQNRIGVNFFMNGNWNNLIFRLPLGIKVQTAKDNANMVFALIEAFRWTKHDKYKEAIKKWIKNFSEKMIINGRVYRFWQLHGKPKNVDLGHIFPILDLLCDTYAFVEKNESYINLAEEIISVCLNDIQWKIGLFPKEEKANKNHLDIQTDFIVTFRRLAELSGKEKYTEMSDNIFKAVLKYHYTDNGFVSSVNEDGIISIDKIEPKYNALLLKAFILMEDRNFLIYGSDFNHGLMKDR